MGHSTSVGQSRKVGLNATVERNGTVDQNRTVAQNGTDNANGTVGQWDKNVIFQSSLFPLFVPVTAFFDLFAPPVPSENYWKLESRSTVPFSPALFPIITPPVQPVQATCFIGYPWGMFEQSLWPNDFSFARAGRVIIVVTHCFPRGPLLAVYKPVYITNDAKRLSRCGCCSMTLQG